MITAAADGSSLNNPGPAGWAWFIDRDNWACGGWPRGTNNMGELMALLQLLNATAVVADEPLRVLCDSQYVINSVSKWMAGWKRRGWVKADKKPVQNLELLKAIDAAITGRDVTFEWVKGHAGHPLNEAADELARGAATAFRNGQEPNGGPGYVAAGANSLTSAPAVAVPILAAPAPTMSPEPEPDLFSVQAATADEVLSADGAVGVDGASRADDFDAVTRSERALLSDEVRSDPAKLRVILHPDFVEYAANGRIWTRARLMAQIGPLERRVSLEVMGQQRLGADSILLRWKAIDSASTSLRSSVWVRDSELGRPRWRLLFAQGTAVQN